MRFLVLLIFTLCSGVVYAQDVPDFRGQDYEEISSWCRQNKYQYSRQNAPDSGTWMLQIIVNRKELVSGGTVSRLRIVKLTFNSGDICIAQESSSKTVESQVNEKGQIDMRAANSGQGSGLEFRKAAIVAITGNGLMVLGTIGLSAAILEPLSDSRTLLVIGGSLLTTTGIVLNSLAWNKVMRAGSRIRSK